MKELNEQVPLSPIKIKYFALKSVVSVLHLNEDLRL